MSAASYACQQVRRERILLCGLGVLLGVAIGEVKSYLCEPTPLPVQLRITAPKFREIPTPPPKPSGYRL